MFKPELLQNFQSLFDVIIGAATSMLEKSLGPDNIIFNNFKEFFKQDTTEFMRWFIAPEGINGDRVDALLRVKTLYPDGYVKGKKLYSSSLHIICYVPILFIFTYKDCLYDL